MTSARRGWRFPDSLRLCVALLPLLGCATSVTIENLVKEGERNQIRALDKYEGESLEVQGIVEHVGLQGFRHGEATWTPGAFGRDTATVTIKRDEYAYVELVPHPEANVRLLCYFSPEDRSEAGDLQVGSRVTLVGVFAQYDHATSGGLVPRLSGCHVRRK